MTSSYMQLNATMPQFLLYLSLALGLLPFRRLDLKSNVLLDFALMLLIPIIYMCCFSLNYFLEEFTVSMLPECVSTCFFVNRLFIQMGFCLYVSVHGFNLFRRKRFYITFEHKLKVIDDLIEHNVRALNYKRKKEKLSQCWWLYLLWILIALALCYVLFYDLYEMINLFNKYFMIPFMATSFPFLTASLVQSQFIYHVTVILKRFRKVNELFQCINEQCNKKATVETLKVYDMDNEFMNKLNKNKSTLKANEIMKADCVDFDIDNAKSYKQMPEIGKRDNCCELYLHELFELHDKMLSLSKYTNDEYGPQCVPYMVVCFVITLLNIFLQTKVIIVVGAQNNLLNYAAIIMGVWSLATMAIAYLILNCCYNTNSCSKKSAMIVLDIMQKKPAFMLGNDVYYNKMKSFSLQYLHWEKYFHFNGIGLFVLDYTFIFSAVSTGTSYLIVLLQFDMSSILREQGLI